MDPLALAVDGRELEGNPTGVGRYLAHLLGTWARNEPSLRLTVYTRGPLPPPAAGVSVVPLAAPTVR